MTTTAPPRLATRVMKARRTSLCPVCRSVIMPGMQIAQLGGIWQHIEHVIERNSRLCAQEHNPEPQPQPQRQETGS